MARGDAQRADAVNVFHCAFGNEWDVNYDTWPDRWVRSTGAEFPHYVKIGIRDDPSALGGKSLQIALDGAAAAVSSPPIRVMPRFSYVFEAQLRIEKLTHSAVVLKLDFCDPAGRVVQTRHSAPLSDTKGWRSVRIENLEPDDPSIDRVVLGLEVLRGARGDLEGRVFLGEVRLERLPRIAVSTNNPSNVYTSLNDVQVKCELSGIPERDPEIRYQLLDSLNQVLQSHDHRLDGRLIVENAGKTGDNREGAAGGPNGYEGTTEWRPEIPDYGYYRIVVRMLSAKKSDGDAEKERILASRTIYLAVVPPLAMPRHGEFGWTLPNGDSPLSFQDLSRLLPQVGINWVKVPVWFDGKDPHRADELIRFVELLGASNVEVVGIIDEPPTSTDAEEQLIRNIAIAEVFTADTAAWAPLLEPVMARLSLRVRWWQLGRDGDTSFVGFPNLNKRIELIRTALFRFGQDVRIGLNWDWANLDAATRPNWDFQQLTSEKPTTEQQFGDLLTQPRNEKVLRWVTLQPPSRAVESQDADAAGPHPAALLPAFCPPWTNMDELLSMAANDGAQRVRASELVRRMVKAKIHGADAIIVMDPFDNDHGLMRASGMPGDLLLPWRTTAVMLGGAKYMGQMQLPSGSENHIFLRQDGQIVMVVWNREPIEETLYLGEHVKQFDMVGRGRSLDEADGEQTIQVGPMPSFVFGLHEKITRWRMAVEFEKRQVPSVFAKPHANSLKFRNFFQQGVGGSMRIVVLQPSRTGESTRGEKTSNDGKTGLLDRWTIEPPQAAFQLAANAEMQFPFEIELRNALFGKQPVRIDFTVEADREYRFRVYSELEVGTKDLSLEVLTHLDKDGALVVEQLMTNQAEQLADFKCYLRAKGHRRQRMQVYRLGKELDRKVYRFGNGSDLIGQEMLLEMEELNGPRELRYRFIVKDMPVGKAAKKNEKRGSAEAPAAIPGSGDVARSSRGRS
jgi:hypothetical protein